MLQGKELWYDVCVGYTGLNNEKVFGVLEMCRQKGKCNY